MERVKNVIVNSRVMARRTDKGVELSDIGNPNKAVQFTLEEIDNMENILDSSKRDGLYILENGFQFIFNDCGPEVLFFDDSDFRLNVEANALSSICRSIKICRIFKAGGIFLLLSFFCKISYF